VIHRWYASLRHAHAVAARQQAVERVERIRELDRQGARNSLRHGWGLGSFGLRVAGEPDVGRGDIEFELEYRNERVSRWQHETLQNKPPPVLEQLQPQISNENEGRSKSLWWWGPLAQWRLQDSTIYR